MTTLHHSVAGIKPAAHVPGTRPDGSLVPDGTADVLAILGTVDRLRGQLARFRLVHGAGCRCGLCANLAARAALDRYELLRLLNSTARVVADQLAADLPVDLPPGAVSRGPM